MLIDIADLPELQAGNFSVTGLSWKAQLGALTTYRALSSVRFFADGYSGDGGAGQPVYAGGVPAVADALAVLADPQVRARGTIGGAVAHGDPASDLPAVLLALDARLAIASRTGTREAALDDFLQGIYTTDLAEGEIVTRVLLAARDARASAYEKFPHPASHLPLAGVAAVLDFDGEVVQSAAIAVTGISGRPYRARSAEAALAGLPAAPESFAAAAALVAQDVSLLGDHHASGEYRAHLAQVLARRAMEKAAARAAAADDRKENS
jgi:carbon-monoxide dehydrogenase medium subunit